MATTKTTTKYQPLGDRVLVKPAEQEEMTKSGILLPDTAKERPQEGAVIAAGPGRTTDDGKLIPMAVKKGDKVLYSKFAGTEVKLDDEEHLILSERDILATIS